jgi:hypothetical protein
MAKDLNKVREQEPMFIQVDEPVSGSSDRNSESVKVLPTGDINSTVTGVDNRVPARNWGHINLLADIIEHGHKIDGSHELSDEDFSTDAGILESRMLLDVYDSDRPDTGSKYSSTADIASVVSQLWPYRNFSLRSSYFLSINNTRLEKSLQDTILTHFDKDTLPTIEGPYDNVVFADNTELFIGTRLFKLKNINSDTDECGMSLMPPEGSENVPSTLTSVGIATLQVFTHDAETTGYVFPLGNVHYKNKNSVSGTHGIDYDHTDQVLAITDSSIEDFIKDPDNNIFYDSNSTLKQLVYITDYKKINYSVYKWGMDDPSFRTHDNQTVIPSKRFRGCWETSDESVLVIPLFIPAQRNAGIYDDVMNPGGTAVKRSGVTDLTSFSQCFSLNNTGYFNNGTECSDYITATYDADADTYDLIGTTYYRSGRQISNKVSSYIGPDTGYCDVVYPDYDIIDLRRSMLSLNEALAILEQKVIAGNVQTDFIPVMYGTSGSCVESSCFSNRPTQVIGFGTTETGLFGSANVGAVFINETNNGLLSTINECRTHWIDASINVITTFNIMCGDSGSESKSTLLTYDPSSRVITLDTTPLSGVDNISSHYTPKLIWDSGDTCVLSTAWSGLGTGTSSCIIDETDHNAHMNAKLYGSVELVFTKGSGTPFIIHDVKDIEDVATNTHHPCIYQKDVIDYKTFTFTGQTGSGNTTLNITLIGSSTTDDRYKNMYITVLNSGSTETRKITAYDATTFTLTVDIALSEAPVENIYVAISALDPSNETSVVVDTYSRGIRGGLKRETLTATADGTCSCEGLILAISTGNNGTTAVNNDCVITGLTSGEIIDVIYAPDVPFINGIKIKFSHSQKSFSTQKITSSDNFKIKKVGSMFETNIGSGNNPSEAYLNFIPCATLPGTDGINWVGTSDVSHVAFFKHLKYDVPWTQIALIEGLNFDVTTMKVDFSIDGSLPELVSINQIIDSNSGVCIGFIMAESNVTHRDIMVVGVKHHGTFGFDKLDNMFVIEVNKLFAVKK